ncbi:MAG: LuxR C-terminal-related transcriptional regulator [Proteobacteria bacterium]|nr:LuxR C-terminal-related transcriptional regulator [Pseudomonadota bacterium]MBU1688034.1 LuxR C-terminal-related transcriptional regulator [Pseudomonadota bacterium]
MSETVLVRILVVDDEQEILDLFVDVLAPVRGLGAERISELESNLFPEVAMEVPFAEPRSSDEVVTCRQGDLAVDLISKSIDQGRPYAVVFLDMRMPPGPDGLWTAQRIRQIDPQVNIVIVTAFTDVDPREIGRLVQPADKLIYLQKPLSRHEITQLSAALCAKWLAENGLRKLNSELEAQIGARTADLRESNIALKVLLRQRDEDKDELDKQLVEADEKLLFNIKKVTLPSLARLKESGLDKHQLELVQILEANLNDVISPVMQRVSTQGTQFTPSELNIANLIKQGKTTKEISDVLHLGTRTVEFHRANIRKKLNITNEKENLKTILLTMT